MVDGAQICRNIINSSSPPTVLACAWDVSTDQCIKTGIAIIGAQLAFHCRHCSTVLHCLTWVFLVAVICEATLYLLRFKTADSQVEELPNWVEFSHITLHLSRFFCFFYLDNPNANDSIDSNSYLISVLFLRKTLWLMNPIWESYFTG